MFPSSPNSPFPILSSLTLFLQSFQFLTHLLLLLLIPLYSFIIQFSNMKNNKTLVDHEHYHHSTRFLNNPSFSSTLLDQIYRSIDQSEQHNYTNTPHNNNMKTFFTPRTEKNKKQSPKDNNKEQFDATSTRRTSRDYDNDVTCFSSTSLSSDSSSSSSSSAGFSSSDTESVYGTRPSRTRSSSSCFLPLRPVRTSASLNEEKGDDHHHRKFHSFRHDIKTELGALIGGDGGQDDYEALSMKSKSRALKIYNNLKKVKQPTSPGAKITSFLNSIFASSKKTKCTNHDIKNIDQLQLHESNDSSARKNVDNDATKLPKSIQTSLPSSTCSFSRSCLSKTLSSEREKLCNDINNLSRLHRPNDVPASLSSKNSDSEERKAKLVQTSTHSSLSSSKSCLSKTLSSEREKLRNGAKRTVRFYPVSVVVGEEGSNNKVATKTWKNSTNTEKSKVVKEAAREFLEEYHKNKNKNNLVLESLMDLHKNNNNKINNANEDEEDDDVASCASSDLFELDHLAELPVYETTHVRTNRAIANGLVV